jgi:hypothetical protein
MQWNEKNEEIRLGFVANAGKHWTGKEDGAPTAVNLNGSGNRKSVGHQEERTESAFSVTEMLLSKGNVCALNAWPDVKSWRSGTDQSSRRRTTIGAN